MTAFSAPEDLQAELVAVLSEFVHSEEGRRTADAARELSGETTLVVHTLEPPTAVSVDFGQRTVTPGAMEGAAAEVEIYADDLHDLMLDRLGPVEISRLSETGRIALTGTPDALAALVLVATAIQPFYPATLRRRGRDDLLGTPAPETGVVWHDSGPPKQLIGTRRPWQRRGRAAEPAA